MYLESVTSDQKTQTLPLSILPSLHPSTIPPKETKVHLELSYCAGKGNIYSHHKPCQYTTFT